VMFVKPGPPVTKITIMLLLTARSLAALREGVRNYFHFTYFVLYACVKNPNIYSGEWEK